MRKFVLAPLLAAAATLTGCSHQDPVANVPQPTLNPPRYTTTPPAPPRHNTPTPEPAGRPSYPQPAPPYRPPSVAGVPRDWVPQSRPVAWSHIVIHHSDTKVGSATSFDRYHREVRKWDSLGYDFVIGNGSLSGDGQIEVGPRWTKQSIGAHAGVKYYNERGIGICLVGDFSQARPTAAQMQSLARLTGYLMKTYRIPPTNVIGHNEAKDGKTTCPGKYMNLGILRRSAAQYAGVEEWILPTFAPLAADTELLHDAE